MPTMSFRIAPAALVLGLWSLAGASAAAPIQLIDPAAAYLQNFDTLAGTGTSSALPAGWAIAEAGSNANTTYTAGTGSGTAGDTYSFGTSGSTDRALGGLQSGTLVPLFGAEFQNLSGSAIASLTIAYTGEQWRFGATGRTAADRMDFQISLNATSLTTGTWTDIDALDFIAPVTAGTVGALDGNAAANRTARAAIIAGLPLANGASFWLRWSDFNASGADDGLAVDDFSLRFTTAAVQSVPEPGSLALAGLALAGMAGLRRRRR